MVMSWSYHCQLFSFDYSDRRGFIQVFKKADKPKINKKKFLIVLNITWIICMYIANSNFTFSKPKQ